jgi:formate dehydrogenase subunit gamma
MKPLPTAMSGPALPRARVLGAALALVLGLLAAAPVSAQTAAAGADAATAAAGADAATASATPKGPPAGYTAPAEPRPDETNAQRGKTQPGNNAPFWRAVRDSGSQQGVATLPGAEQGVLVQPFTQYPGSRLTTAGEAWRQVRNGWIIPYGGALFLIAALALGLFYWRMGPLGGHVADTGRKIERFTAFERAAHWSVAGSFVALAVSGLVMAFGKFVLLPVFGATLFGWLSYALKTLHNFAGPVFAVALAVFIVTYVRDNLPRADDLRWLLRAGGMFGGREVPSHRFNAGEKVVFWGGVIVLGLIVVASGLVLDRLVPGLGYPRADMQAAHLFHAAASVLMMTLFLGHIYLGSIGMKGAYQGMATGLVDEAWAREHHELWYDDIQAGRIAAHRTPGVAGHLGAASSRV